MGDGAEEDGAGLFWGERYQMSQWVSSLGNRLYHEIPVGELALSHYRLLDINGVATVDEAVVSWKQALQTQGVVYGLRSVVQAAAPFHGIHVLREARETLTVGEIERYEADGTKVPTGPEEEVPGTRLDLWRKRPLLTLSLLDNEQQSFERVFERWRLPERVLPYLRAGASAVVGPWWPTSEAADQLFWTTFYDLVYGMVPLGEAVWRARLAVRDGLPEQVDWLAYGLYGDPRGQPYVPEKSEGYTALTCLNPDQPLLLGQTYYFQASIRTKPPVWYRERLVETEALPQAPSVLFLAPGLQEEVPEPMEMERQGETAVVATYALTPQKTGAFSLIARLMDGEERLQSLRLELEITDAY